MTVLETSSGKLVAAGRRNSWMSRSTPLGALGSVGSSSVTLIGGATISFAQLYRTQPWVAANVNKLSRQMARLPLKAYRLGEKGSREQVLDGPLAELLKTPWERGSAMSLKQAIAFPTTLHGNSVLAKSREFRGGPVTSLVPLDWRFLVPRLDDRGGVIFWETWQTGTRIFLDPSDVIHFAWEAPDGDLGVSPLQQLGTTIKLEDSVQRYNTASFENAVRPSGGFVVDKDQTIRPEERNEIREEIEQASGGIDNAFKLMILGGGMDWKPFSQTAKEAELIESRRLNREEVAAVFDIPPPMLGILDKATFSNITEQHKMLFTTILGPWLGLIQETIQAQLIDTEPAFAGHFVEFDLNELLKGDPEKRIPALAKAVESGIYTINEARRMENLPPSNHPHADIPLIAQNNLKPLGADDEEDAPVYTETAKATAVSAHLTRARDVVLSRVGAGKDDPFDAVRFERELAADTGDQALAESLASSIAEGLEQAGTDPDLIKQFFSALLSA